MNKKLKDIIENEFDCLIDDLSWITGEEWMADSIKKVVEEAFNIGKGVVSPECSKPSEVKAESILLLENIGGTYTVYRGGKKLLCQKRSITKQ